MLKRCFLMSVLSAALLSVTAYAQPTQPSVQPLSPELAQRSSITADGALRKELAYGIYQMAYSASEKALYVASAEMLDGVRGGALYKLDPQTLDVLGVIHTDESNFGLSSNAEGNVLFMTNSLNPAVARVELGEKGGLKRTAFSNMGTDGFKVGPRTVKLDEAHKRLYVGGVGNPAVIWVLDTSSMEVLNTIENAGKWVTGLLLDTDHRRMYAGNGDGEVLVIDTDKNQIQQRWKPAGDKPAIMLNFALDPKRNRLYATENQHQKTVYVLDASTGKLLEQLDVGDALDIVYNPKRDELYVSHRQQGKVSVLDAGSYAKKAEYSLPAHPNSLLLGPDDQLYVTVKAPFTPDHKVSARESVVRIDLSKI